MARTPESESPHGFYCSNCKEFHPGLPFSFGTDSPDNYAEIDESDRPQRAVLSSDQCIIDEREFYIRGIVEVPIIGFADNFLWGLWVNVWPNDFERIHANWETPGREELIGPFKGRLANGLRDIYQPSLANLKCTIRIQPIHQRPTIFIDEPSHPLAIEQRNGITLERVQHLAGRLVHRMGNMNSDSKH
ncbi:MAG TPA: DUF2199 domain-containing protein [Terriglobales bacterium]|jgi:hypothetical protein|nr:DUF2199 domain-containing protein [Terriglobales bacterium]